MRMILRREIARIYERKRIEVDADRDVDELHAEDSRRHRAIEMREALQALPPHYREPLLLQVLGGSAARRSPGCFR
jgi:DNA-directed RNA polymerase specialized sigma24 family protein